MTHNTTKSSTRHSRPFSFRVIPLVMLAATGVLSACAATPVPSAPPAVASPPIVAPLDASIAVDGALAPTPDSAPDSATAEPVAIVPLAADPKPAPRVFGFLRRNRTEPLEPAPAQIAPLEPAPETIAIAEAVSVETPDTSLIAAAPTEGAALESGQDSADTGILAETPIRTLSDEELIALTTVSPKPAEPVKRAGLFGLLRNRAPERAPLQPVADLGALDPADTIPAEAEADSLVITAAVPEPEKRRGLGALFSMRAEAAVPPNPGFDPSAVVNGIVPFGEVAKVCGLKKRDMGAEVARSGGSGAYRLFDTEPASTLQRAQFITGFRDGCSRRVTGALTLFGAFDVHEAKRYSKTNRTPYSEVDLAYEKVKSRICGVGKGQRCPAAKAERLNREVAFLTVYRAFGSSGAWMELFMHKGDLVAFSTVNP